jgi:hypothetical protein
MTHINQNLGGVCGLIGIVVVGEDGKVREEIPQFKNLITDYGFDQAIGTPTSFGVTTTWCAVGTSSTTPQFTDVALGAQVGTRTSSLQSSNSVNSGSPLYYHSYTRTFAFTQGQVTGNLAEVGFFGASSGSNCGSRALIKDGAGNPTTLTVLGTDTLYITYEMRWYPNLSDTTGSFLISGVTYNYTQRTRGVGGTSSPLNNTVIGGYSSGTWETQTLAALGSTPSGSVVYTSSGALNSYSAGTKYRDVVHTALPAAANHATGIGIFEWGLNSSANSNAGFYTSVTPKIPKLNTQTLTLTLRQSIARI